ncbi:MAG TPA: ABC transporter permease, partial [Terriglobales bacterium]
MKLRSWLLLPSWIWMAVLFIAPLAIVLAYSFLSRGIYGGVEQPWVLESYQRLFDPLYLKILLRSFVMALLATAICLVLAYPAALFISRSGKHKNLYLQLVMLPFWTSFLVRTYAWLFLLRDTGLINLTLQRLGIIHSPLPLLYNDGAVLLGLVYGYLPFMVLPIYATLERLDPSLPEAAADLGARPLATVFRVIVPLSRPGII